MEASYLTQPTQILKLPWNVPFTSPLAPVPLTNPVTQDNKDTDSDSTTDDEAELESHPTNVQLAEYLEPRSISDGIYSHRKTGLMKVEPFGRPEVWANGRQEMYETRHHFRSYQSTCYCTGGFVPAFVFVKVAHVRDYMDSDVVIMRAGGGLVKNKDSSEMRSGKDQSDETSIVKALKNCMRHFNPLIIVTGVDNPHVPSQPPHQYCTLDYFEPTHMWTDKSGKSKILRSRFEKLNTKKESWWEPKDERDPFRFGSLAPLVEARCIICGVMSHQIYLNSWMCLQSGCTASWHLVNDIYPGAQSTSHKPEEASLIYDPRFLKQKMPWPNDHQDYPLSFNTPIASGFSVAGEDSSPAFWSGIVCLGCGCCNSCLSWMGWECLNSQVQLQEGVTAYSHSSNIVARTLLASYQQLHFVL
jgi:hypothetical protein